MVVLEPLNKLIQHKWDTFAARRFYLSFFSYLMFMIIFSVFAYHCPLHEQVSQVRFDGVERNSAGAMVVTALTAVLTVLLESCSLCSQWSSMLKASCGSLD